VVEHISYLYCNICQMTETMQLKKHMSLVHEVSVNAPSDKVWDFLINIEKNYIAWHPKDHILFQWTKGTAFEAGARFYAEQYMMGVMIKYNGTISESIPGQKISMTFSFPLSLITDKIEIIIENHGAATVFRHVTHMKFRFLSRTIFKKRNINMLLDMDTHIKSEGENMKKILENVHQQED